MGVASVITATALARHLIQRVPFEAKPVLLAVQEAAELATAGEGGCEAGASSTGRSGKRKHVSGKGEGFGSAGLAAVASLLKGARAAVQSPLLPLPVPVLRPPPRSERGEGGGASGTSVLSLDGDPQDSAAREPGGVAADASPASVTAEMLLGTFVQSPAAVRRSVREAMQQG